MQKGVLNNSVEKIVLSDRILVSVVIPHYHASREPMLRALIHELGKQTFRDLEILVVRQVSPQGKAINTGAEAAEGDILIVMDDDASMDQPNVVENLVRTLQDNPDIAMAGASIVSPPDLNSFQKAAAKQFPRFHMPIVKEITDSDLACHGCVAFPMDVFKKVGMERDDILRGLDPDLRVRIRKAGYRVVLVPDTWMYHPFPPSVFKFMRLFFRNGYGSAYLQVFYPEIAYDTDEAVASEKFVPKRSFGYRLLRFPMRLLKSLVTLQWIRFLGYTVYSFGYVVGYLKFSFGR